ncbi:MAG TPA: galactokinase, partial [Kiritimatiellia bacterium]|nr:galactokinase [Kiritimatiellia bacterium]
AVGVFGVHALRDVDHQTFNDKAALLDPVTRRRARHVITENQRTLAAAAAMERGDAATLGRLMNESHDSLRDDFEVTNDALNTMVEAARSHPGCWGARMTGAGFGGCAVALVATPDVASFMDHVTTAYRQAGNQAPNLYAATASAGASADSHEKSRE